MCCTKPSNHKDDKSRIIEKEKRIYSFWTLSSALVYVTARCGILYEIRPLPSSYRPICRHPSRFHHTFRSTTSMGGTEAGRELFFPSMNTVWNSLTQAAHQAAAGERLPPQMISPYWTEMKWYIVPSQRLSGNVGGILAFWGHFVSLSAHSCSKIMFSYLQLCCIN